MKHSQGNWTYKHYSQDIGVYSEEGNSNDICLVREYSDKEEAEANAMLIAAAPELLKALIKAKETIELLAEEANYQSHRWQSEHLTPIKEVINKATKK